MSNSLESQWLSLLELTNGQLVINSQWNSEAKDHRDQVREHLVYTLTRHEPPPEPAELERLRDLSQPPHLVGFSISISHCKKAGGVMWIKDPHFQVGLDMEDRLRVSAKVVARVSEAKEMSRAPHPALIWTAKEATFKSLLGVSQPRIVSDIQIDTWIPLSSEIWRFQAQVRGLNQRPVEGLAGFRDDLVLGLAKFRP